MSKFWIGLVAGASAIGFIVAYDALYKPYLPAPETVEYTKPSSISGAERIFEDALEIRMPGHRWEEFDVTVASCEVRIFKHDNDCTTPTNLHTFEIVYDLRRMRLETDFRDPFVGQLGRVQFVDVSPRREFEAQMRRIKARSDSLIDEARAEVGWGPDAAALKSERFAAEFSEADLPGWRRTNVCNGGVYFDVYDRTFVFQLPDLNVRDELLGAVEMLEKHCASIRDL